MTKPDKQEKIQVSGSRGTRKHSFEFTARNEVGHVVHRISGRVAHLKTDKRRKKNRRYVRLCGFDPHGVFMITKNLTTGRLSLAIRPTNHPLYETLDARKVMKLFAALRVCGLLGILEWESNAKTLNITSEHLVTGIAYYEAEFRDKIRKARKALKLSLSHHRRKA